MKYILCGTQGTGKTSVLKHFDGKMNTITEVVRNLVKDEHIPVNEQGTEHGQRRIFDTYYEILSKTEAPYISDRGLVDVLAYTCYNMKDKGEKGEKFMDELMERFVHFQEVNPDVVYFYVPIEFDVVWDGFRSMDEDFRKEIDKNIKDLLDAMNVDYIELRGTVEERLEIIENVMKKYGDLNYE